MLLLTIDAADAAAAAADADTFKRLISGIISQICPSEQKIIDEH